MDSPHRQARALVRTNARRDRSSPYSRPRSQTQSSEPALSRTTSTRFFDLLGRAVTWWVGTAPNGEGNGGENAGGSDDEMRADESDDDGMRTPLGPPGGFGRLDAVQHEEMGEDDDDEVQEVSPPEAPAPSYPAVHFQPLPPPPLRASVSDGLVRRSLPSTPQQTSLRPAADTEDKSPEKINAAIADFFKKKGNEPLSLVELYGVQKMLDDLKGSVNGGPSEPFRLGAPAHATPTFHLGTPDRSSSGPTTATRLTPSRTAPSRMRSTPVYIGPGFGGAARMRSSTKPELPVKIEASTPGENSNSLSRSTLSASMLAGPSTSQAHVDRSPETLNPSMSARFANRPAMPSPLRNAVSQDSRSSTSERVSPPKKGPTIAASILKDLMDADKKEMPLTNPYQSRPGAIKGKVKPRAKPSPEKAASPARSAVPQPAKPAVNGVKELNASIREPQTGAKRDAYTAALDEPSPPKSLAATAPVAKGPVLSQQPAAPSPSASKKAKTSITPAQEVFELPDSDDEGAAPPTLEKAKAIQPKETAPVLPIFKAAMASQPTAKPTATSFGSTTGLSFPNPSFDASGSSPFTAPSQSSIWKTDTRPPVTPTPPVASTQGDSPQKKAEGSAKPPAFAGFGQLPPAFGAPGSSNRFASFSTTSSSQTKPADMFKTPAKSDFGSGSTEALSSTPFGTPGTGFGSVKPTSSTSALGTSGIFGMGTKSPTETVKEPVSQPARRGLFDFGTTSNAFGASSPSNTIPTTTAPLSFGGPKTDAVPVTASFGSIPATSLLDNTSSPFPDTSKTTTNVFGASSSITSFLPLSENATPVPTSKSSTTGMTGFGTLPSFGSAFSLPSAKPSNSAPQETLTAKKDASGLPSDTSPASSAATPWDKILSQSTYHQASKPDLETAPDFTMADASSKPEDKLPLPTFAFVVQTPTPSMTAASLPVSKGKLPIYDFATKFGMDLPKAAASAPQAPAPSVSAAPVVPFNFAAAGLVQPPSGTWTCAECYVPNKADAVQCVSCETPRPGVSEGTARAASTDDEVSKTASVTAPATAPAATNAWASFFNVQLPPGKVKCKTCDCLTSDSGEKCEVCEEKNYR